MLKNLLTKAKGYATPERVAAVKSGAAKAMDAANRGAGMAQARISQAMEERKQRQQAELETISQQQAGNNKTRLEDLHPDVQKTLQNYVNFQAASETETRVRGAGLIDLTTPQSQQLLRSKTPPGAMCIAGVPLDPGDEQQHILLSGAPGTGKSVEIKKALRTIRQRGQKAVVYDPSGEFTSLFYRPGRDIILNPLDQRGAKWNPWGDADTFEYNAVAKSFIPDRGGEADPFWAESARATFEALLMQCNSLDELVYQGLSAPLSELAGIVNDAGFGGLIGPEKTFQSTRATLAVYLRSLGMLENVQRDDQDAAFSFRNWLNPPDSDDSWVFLPVPARARDAIRPLSSMFLDTAVRHVMGLRPDPDRRIWLVIDELPSLQNIPSIHPALAEGRKFGIGAILGVQTFHQLKKTFGDAGAAALWGLPKTRLYLRIGDAETSEMISKELGDVQLKRKTTSTGSSEGYSDGGKGSNTSGSSTNTSEQTVTERIVLPAEVGGLPDLIGYLRTGGSHRVAKVRVEFDGIPRRGEQDDFVWRPQRKLSTAESIAKEKEGVMQQAQKKIGGDGMKEQEVKDPEVLEQTIRKRALALMKESMERWDDQSVASLTDDEVTELTGIFIERARLELASSAAVS